MPRAARLLSGVGNPNGVARGEPGDIFTDRVGGTLYLKMADIWVALGSSSAPIRTVTGFFRVTPTSITIETQSGEFTGATRDAVGIYTVRINQNIPNFTVNTQIIPLVTIEGSPPPQVFGSAKPGGTGFGPIGLGTLGVFVTTAAGFVDRSFFLRVDLIGVGTGPIGPTGPTGPTGSSGP